MSELIIAILISVTAIMSLAVTINYMIKMKLITTETAIAFLITLVILIFLI